MPKCCACSNSQSKLNEGNLCRSCRAKAKDGDMASQMATNSNVTNSLDMNKGIGELSIGDLITLIQQTVSPIVAPITVKLDGLEKKVDDALTKMAVVEKTALENTTKITKLEEETGDNKDNIESIDNYVGALKKVILKQQKFLESVRRKDLANILIMSGIPTENLTLIDESWVSVEEKVSNILKFIGCQSIHYELLPVKEVDNQENMFVKLKLNNFDDVKEVLDNAKKLKDFNPAKIYINKDEPYNTRKENNRLRKKKANLVMQHGRNAGVKIEKGKLYHNNTVVD